jgi:hypothetical protein
MDSDFFKLSETTRIVIPLARGVVQNSEWREQPFSFSLHRQSGSSLPV